MSPPKKPNTANANGVATSPANANNAGPAENMDQSAVLRAIDTMRSELLAKMDEKAEIHSDLMRKQITILREEMRTANEQANNRVNLLDERTASLEAAANTHSDAIANLEQQVNELKREVVNLKAKTEDLEGRSRRCNLRVLGIKEGREHGTRVSDFIAGLFEEVFKLNARPVIDRAHRTLQQAPGTDQPPRAFVVKCHYYQEKETILRKALSSQKLVTRDGDVIKVFPDYSQSVARQRAAFGPVKQLLRRCEGVKYGLLYPAKLLVSTRDGEQKTFIDPVKAATFAKELQAS